MTDFLIVKATSQLDGWSMEMCIVNTTEQAWGRHPAADMPDMRLERMKFSFNLRNDVRGSGGSDTGTLDVWTSVDELQHNVSTTLTWGYWKCLRMKQRSLVVRSLAFNVQLACPRYLKRCACCARGPGYLRLGDWYSWDSRAWLVFWLGLLANLTVIGSVAPGGFWQFRPLIASSASTRRSKRMKPTPLETPVVSDRPILQLSTHKQLWQ